MFWRVPSNGNLSITSHKSALRAKKTLSRPEQGESSTPMHTKKLLAKMQGCFLRKTNWKEHPNWKHLSLLWKHFSFSQAWKRRSWEWQFTAKDMESLHSTLWWSQDESTWKPLRDYSNVWFRQNSHLIFWWYKVWQHNMEKSWINLAPSSKLR